MPLWQFCATNQDTSLRGKGAKDTKQEANIKRPSLYRLKSPKRHPSDPTNQAPTDGNNSQDVQDERCGVRLDKKQTFLLDDKRNRHSGTSGGVYSRCEPPFSNYHGCPRIIRYRERTKTSGTLSINYFRSSPTRPKISCWQWVTKSLGWDKAKREKG